MPLGWWAETRGPVLVFGNNRSFVLVRARPYSGNLHEVVRQWLEEHALWGEARLFIRKTSAGLALMADGLSFPVALASQPLLSPARSYRDLTLLIPGRKMVLLVSTLVPAGESEEHKAALQVLNTLRLLPPSARVPYRVEEVVDPVYGIPAVWVCVPEGYHLTGQVYRPGGGSPDYLWEVEGPAGRAVDTRLFVQTYATGGMAVTLVTWKGQTFQMPGVRSVQGPEEMVQLLLRLWEQETGQPWELVRIFELPPNSVFEEAERIIGQAFGPLQGQMEAMGTYVEQSSIRIGVVARAGSQVRVGVAFGWIFGLVQPGFMGSQIGGLVVPFFRYFEFRDEQDIFLLSSVLRSARLNPRWVALRIRESRQISQEMTRMVLEYSQAAQEFETRSNLAWANILSEQIFAKDPATGEIFQLADIGGNFWRDPASGEILAVEPGSELEELLQAQGWRLLPQSLEGFPEQWW